MPTIKTHCWCVFSDADAAARAVEGLQGLRFPDHRVDGRTLSAALVAVEDARRIIEAQSEAVLQGAGEADAAGAADDRAPVVRRGRAPDRLLGDALHQAVQDVGARNKATRVVEVVRRDGEGRMAAGSRSDERPAPRRGASPGRELREDRPSRDIRDEELRGMTTVGRGMDPRDVPGVRNGSDAREGRGDAGRELRGRGARDAAPPEPEPPSLDDLFRKTQAKPVIYWNPRTEVEALAVGQARNGEYPEVEVAFGDLPDTLREEVRRMELAAGVRSGGRGHGGWGGPRRGRY